MTTELAGISGLANGHVRHPVESSFSDGRIGRVYRIAGMDERWKWNMTASIGNRVGTTAGIARTRDEACDAVELHYEVMKAATRDQE